MKGTPAAVATAAAAAAKSLQLCPTLCNPINYCLPGSSVHGILQARILEWLAMPFSRGIFPTQRTSLASPELADGFFTPDHLGSPHTLIPVS